MQWFSMLSQKKKYKSLGAGLSQQMTFCSKWHNTNRWKSPPEIMVNLGQSSETIYRQEQNFTHPISKELQ